MTISLTTPAEVKTRLAAGEEVVVACGIEVGGDVDVARQRGREAVVLVDGDLIIAAALEQQ